MRIAAYQMPVSACYARDAVEHLSTRVRECEHADVRLLCCPEGALGGLADYMDSPDDIPVPLDSRVLGAMLRPLASKTVTVIVGFTERDELGRYYNAAAVYSGGSVLGIYRKQHVAIRRSRYTSGRETQIFNSTVGTLGILICRDSVDAGLASTLVQRGARILCIPTNNAMPRDRGGPHLVDEIRVLDAQYAMTLGVPVIRADVVGATGGLVSAGASMITPPTRAQRCANGSEDGELIVAELP